MLNFEFLDPDEIIGSKDFSDVEAFLKATQREEIGWHYIIDLTWIYRLAKNWKPGIQILDAGGGGGPTQFLLAEMGFDIVNIDLTLRQPSMGVAKRYGCRLRHLPSFKQTQYGALLSTRNIKNKFKNNINKFLSILNRDVMTGKHCWHESLLARKTNASVNRPAVGEISWVLGNIADMPDIASQTFDAVVSLSALEHIPITDIGCAIREIKRVVKKDARWAVTTSGTEKEKTWFHKPSQGWCYSVTDIENLFQAEKKRPQVLFDLLDRYKSCYYLKENLNTIYRQSGDNGMPWGVWDPKYLPVGLYR